MVARIKSSIKPHLYLRIIFLNFFESFNHVSRVKVFESGPGLNRAPVDLTANTNIGSQPGQYFVFRSPEDDTDNNPLHYNVDDGIFDKTLKANNVVGSASISNNPRGNV